MDNKKDYADYKKYAESIDNNSLWITATPSAAAQTLPFYIMEAGHFLAKQDYTVKRECHDSFLLLYTIEGEGTFISGDTNMLLCPGRCAVVDCHHPHEYYSNTEAWEFLWMHFSGSGAPAMLKILYPDTTQPIALPESAVFASELTSLFHLTRRNDISSCVEASARMHTLFQNLLQAQLKTEREHQKDAHSQDIAAALSYIQEHFSQSITIDDMIRDIPISKYHFIRLFRREMGVTPYSYLTNYRINRSKILLRSTQKTIADIAEACGFLDTSNFITQFKKHTGVRPTHYRKDFQCET